jgi:hypothetical protein
VSRRSGGCPNGQSIVDVAAGLLAAIPTETSHPVIPAKAGIHFDLQEHDGFRLSPE